MYKRLLAPGGLVEVEGILFEFPVHGHKALLVDTVPAALITAIGGEVKEIILALSPDVEGRATAAYLAELLADLPVKLTRPALGLPAGSNLSFADSATISAAFSGRTDLK